MSELPIFCENPPSRCDNDHVQENGIKNDKENLGFWGSRGYKDWEPLLYYMTLYYIQHMRRRSKKV